MGIVSGIYASSNHRRGNRNWVLQAKIQTEQQVSAADSPMKASKIQAHLVYTRKLRIRPETTKVAARAPTPLAPTAAAMIMR